MTKYECAVTQVSLELRWAESRWFIGWKVFPYYNATEGAPSEKINYEPSHTVLNIYSDIISRSLMGENQDNICDVIPINPSYTFNRAHIKYKKEAQLF